MLRRFALTLLLATTTSVLAANQPGEARRSRSEAVIPPLPADEAPVEAPVPAQVAALAADEIDEHAQVVELAASLPPASAGWSVTVMVDERTRCALGPSVDCLANDSRLRAAGILLDPDDPVAAAPPAAASQAGPAASRTATTVPAPTARQDQPPAPRPAPHETVAPPRPRAAALRAFTPEFVPVPAPARVPSQRRDPSAPEGSGVIAPMQWRIAPSAWLDLRPRTELNLARGQATIASVPNEPVDGGPPIPGTARARLGISVPLEAFRPHTSKSLAEAAPPPGVARQP